MVAMDEIIKDRIEYLKREICVLKIEVEVLSIEAGKSKQFKITDDKIIPIVRTRLSRLKNLNRMYEVNRQYDFMVVRNNTGLSF